jgi:hypothetical protein
MRRARRQQREQRSLLPGRQDDDIAVHARLDRAQDGDVELHGRGQHYARSERV